MSRAHPLRTPSYLQHIQEAIGPIEGYVGGMDEQGFIDDLKTQDAVIRNFEIIGEACNNISKHHPEFAARHAEIPWGFAYEMRNVLAHGYFKVDLEVVWRTIRNDLPSLARQIEELLKASFPTE